jgi:hypothetical protein
VTEDILELTIPEDDSKPVYVDVDHPSFIEGKAKGAIVDCIARIPRPDQAQHIFTRIVSCPDVVVYGHGDFRYVTMHLERIDISKDDNFYMVKYKVVASHTR